MLDWERMANIHIEYWSDLARAETGVNAFDGEWQISDHSLIPQPLHNFLMERFPKKTKINQIPIEDVNAALNEVWEGAGSMHKVVAKTAELSRARRAAS